ncbi:MAG: radical SAM/SPASM domain-containing protein [Candidatus Omnitrophica bacterium]|jgi:hypothetical protein|nr:radical SAM/SPASM domain-containing protein [Candidatus Omnitrophota bacterium]
MNLEKIQLPPNYNYIACFLTLDCNLKCDYCINWHSGIKNNKYPLISGKKWVEALNRLISRPDLPVTLQGGEPGLHPDFIWLIKNIKEDLNIDILTNLTFDVDKFILQIKPSRLSRNAPYPNIRVSYHPGYMNLEILIKKVLKLQAAGFSIGIFSVLHPKLEKEISLAEKKCQDLGIDFRTKEFLGWFNNKLYGTYRYPGAVGSSHQKKCLCRTSELIIGPDGSVFRCHHDLYENFPSVGNILNPDFIIKDIFKKCSQFGNCNPCDIKTKTNRFQIFGHTAVEIKCLE